MPLEVSHAVSISIHAPRMGSDSSVPACLASSLNFNPRSPDGERHRHSCNKVRAIYDFNPRSPDGERREVAVEYSLRDEFQSTLPGWGATGKTVSETPKAGRISIHAPRMGSDYRASHSPDMRRDFNPRSPDGERRCYICGRPIDYTLFQSTLPGWGATHSRGQSRIPDHISIHAPRMGSDERHFTVHTGGVEISIHAPRMGSDRCLVTSHPKKLGFQSTLPGWGATRHPDGGGACRFYFNPRSPDGERLILGGLLQQSSVNFNPRSPDGERLARCSEGCRI